MKKRKTLATISKQLNDIVSTMGETPIYFSAEYDNKTHYEAVSEKIDEIVKQNKRVLGHFSIRQTPDNTYKIGVCVYPDEMTRTKAEKKGVDYDRLCF